MADFAPVLMNTKQAACYTGFSYSQFRKLLKEKPEQMPKPVRIGGCLRFPKSEIDHFIENQL